VTEISGIQLPISNDFQVVISGQNPVNQTGYENSGLNFVSLLAEASQKVMKGDVNQNSQQVDSQLLQPDMQNQGIQSVTKKLMGLISSQHVESGNNPFGFAGGLTDDQIVEIVQEHNLEFSKPQLEFIPLPNPESNPGISTDASEMDNEAFEIPVDESVDSGEENINSQEIRSAEKKITFKVESSSEDDIQEVKSSNLTSDQSNRTAGTQTEFNTNFIKADADQTLNNTVSDSAWKSDLAGMQFHQNNTPPDPSPPPGAGRKVDTAGPRGKDQTLEHIQTGTRSQRNTEEAAVRENHREFSKVEFLSDEWKNGTWRKPVNQVVREKVEFQIHENQRENASQPTLQKAGQTEIQMDKSQADVKAIKPQQVDQVSPKIVNWIAQPKADPGQVSRQGVDIQSVAPEEVRAVEGKRLDIPIQGEVKVQVESPVETQKNQSSIKQQNVDDEKSGLESEVSSKQDRKSFDLGELTTGKSTQFAKSPVTQQEITPSQGNPVAVTHTSSEVLVSQVQPVATKLIEVKEPVSILGDAPLKVASEVAQATSDLPQGTKAVLKVELRPPRLGPVDIEIIKTDQGLDVKLVVRTVFAKELIMQRGDEIRNALQSNGLEIRKFEIVDLNLNRQDSNNQGGSSGFQGTPFGQDGNNHGYRQEVGDYTQTHFDDAELEIDQASASSRQTDTEDNNRLDVFA
jgi:flagellar hook-length control protein FliK